MIATLKQIATAGLVALAAQAGIARSAVLPDARTYGATSYLSAGASGEQAEAMKEIAPRYNLRLVFAATTGQYLDGFRHLERVANLKPQGSGHVG